MLLTCSASRLAVQLVRCILGIGAATLIIVNIETAQQLVSVPTLVYAVGGVMIALIAVFTYIKFTVL